MIPFATANPGELASLIFLGALLASTAAAIFGHRATKPRITFDNVGAEGAWA